MVRRENGRHVFNMATSAGKYRTPKERNVRKRKESKTGNT